MNDTSIVTRSKRRASSGSCSGVSVRALMRSMHDHARIAAQLPVELAVADVERDDTGRAALEQHVGEPAGRRADVERQAALPARSPKASSACASLTPPRPTYGMIGHVERDARRRPRRRSPALRRRLAVDPHLAGEDQRARALARRGEPALDEQRVEADRASSMRARHDPSRDRRQLAAEAGRRAAPASALLRRTSAARRRDSSSP